MVNFFRFAQTKFSSIIFLVRKCRSGKLILILIKFRLFRKFFVLPTIISNYIDWSRLNSDREILDGHNHDRFCPDGFLNRLAYLFIFKIEKMGPVEAIF